MNYSIVFLVLLVVSGVFCQILTTEPPGQFDKILIDDFSEGREQGFIETFAIGDTFDAVEYFPVTPGTPVNRILGGERDLRLVVSSVTSRNSITSIIGVNQGVGVWEVATPASITGWSSLQWDGVDNRSGAFELSTTGLGPVDFSDNGNNRHLRIRISRDISAVFQFRAASTSGVCEFTLGADGTDGNTEAILDLWLPFADWTSGCNWSAIGGLEIIIRQEINVDARLFLVAISGSTPPSQSNTPTPTGTPSTIPIPSQSPTPTGTGTGTRTPTPVPSQSRTPTPTPTQTRTPTPTPSPECICICPAFTCALIFDPDDDVNNVYYFTGPGFTFPDQPDDDDDNLNPTNSFTISVGNSGASVLTVSIALIAIIVALF